MLCHWQRRASKFFGVEHSVWFNFAAPFDGIKISAWRCLRHFSWLLPTRRAFCYLVKTRMGKHYLPIQKANTSRKNQWYTHCSNQQLIVPKTLLTTHSTIPHVGLRNTIKDLGVYGITINSSSRVGCSERSQLNTQLTFTVVTDATARESKHGHNCGWLQAKQ